jgi:hypothetical protein
MRQFSSALLLSLGLLSACTWLPLTPEGQQVVVESSAQAVASCELKGTTHANTKHKVGFIPRGADFVKEELTTLARNDAAKMGGNTVVAQTPVQDGQQTFGIYACRR